MTLYQDNYFPSSTILKRSYFSCYLGPSTIHSLTIHVHYQHTLRALKVSLTNYPHLKSLSIKWIDSKSGITLDNMYIDKNSGTSLTTAYDNNKLNRLHIRGDTSQLDHLLNAIANEGVCLQEVIITSESPNYLLSSTLNVKSIKRLKSLVVKIFTNEFCYNMSQLDIEVQYFKKGKLNICKKIICPTAYRHKLKLVVNCCKLDKFTIADKKGDLIEETLLNV